MTKDAVNHPPHYTLGGVEVIDAIEAWDLGFCLGNAVKYIARAGKKDPAKTLEDLEKARWYIDREVQRRRSGVPAADAVDAAPPAAVPNVCLCGHVDGSHRSESGAPITCTARCLCDYEPGDAREE